VIYKRFQPGKTVLPKQAPWAVVTERYLSSLSTPIKLFEDS
jgi:hypothetical protein